MKNTYGNSLSVTLFGESHGAAIGAVIDGIAPGIFIDKEYINKKLDLRRPWGKISTSRNEDDEFKILSGVFNKKTTGTPISIIIQNKDTNSSDYEKFAGIARPGHADYAAFCKYYGFEDYRGGGHFSGRITAALVVAGSVLQHALENKGIYIGTHIKECSKIKDDEFSNFLNDFNYLNNKKFAVLNDSAEKKMIEAIESAAKDQDSVGGILETAVVGMPAGIGEPWFDSVESNLAHILFSIPAVKGVEFGKGFDFAAMLGSQANDTFCITDRKIVSNTNNNAGINGGITNGMPIIFKTAVKPTPSISKPQNTVDFKNMNETKISVNGRHDPAIIHRARVVVDSVTAICLADLLTLRFGTDYLRTDSI